MALKGKGERGGETQGNFDSEYQDRTYNAFPTYLRKL